MYVYCICTFIYILCERERCKSGWPSTESHDSLPSNSLLGTVTQCTKGMSRLSTCSAPNQESLLAYVPPDFYSLSPLFAGENCLARFTILRRKNHCHLIFLEEVFQQSWFVYKKFPYFSTCPRSSQCCLHKFSKRIKSHIKGSTICSVVSTIFISKSQSSLVKPVNSWLIPTFSPISGEKPNLSTDCPGHRAFLRKHRRWPRWGQGTIGWPRRAGSWRGSLQWQFAGFLHGQPAGNLDLNEKIIVFNHTKNAKKNIPARDPRLRGGVGG